MAAKIDTLTPLQRAFLALEESEARLTAVTAASREPIAVIGLGCRVPGGGDNPERFWQLLRDGVDAITPVPAGRWDHDAFYDPDPATPGHIATRCGGFIGGVDAFDPGFFSIAPREAESMDPQQRLLLEVSWEALEHAGQAPDRLENSATGVFIGAAASDYANLQLKSGDEGLLDAHFTSGIAHSVISGRLSFLLGLRGPSLTVDTACSSSLVAIHLACQALRNSECGMALAGGVNLILGPDLFIALSRARMLAPDGRCKTFDAAADGFARAEGCGVVVLRRLSDARADGDRILAVISGSAVNQDGASSSLTAPSGPAQEAVIRSALAFADLAPRQIGYIEAHGTGTQLGDPLEVRALGAVFGADRTADKPLLIGSVKTNLGHLEAAAGVTSLIKIVLALRHRLIPPHLHFHSPSPHIPWDSLPLRVPTEPVDWAPIQGRRIAGLSSFGFSGTNAHVIVEEATPDPRVRQPMRDRASLLAVSARDEVALRELAARQTNALSRRMDLPLADIAHTMNAGRKHFTHRATVMAETIEEARAGLQALARDSSMAAVRGATVTRRDPLRIAFLFTGQGAQYPGMGKGLYEASSVFRAALDRCAEILRPHLDRPLLDVMFADATRLLETAYTQPALFALEYALSELWRSWAVTPNVLIGHSVGEYVAACVAGVFSLEDALALIGLRGRLLQSLPAGGAMAAISAPHGEVADAVSPLAATVSIAGLNGPAETVISGAAADVARICHLFAVRGIQHKALSVSHAFHSPLVEPVLDQFEAAVSAIKLSPPRLRVISNLTGKTVSADELTQPAYWRRHMRETVLFADGVRTLEQSRVDCCVEIGPTPTLLSLAVSTLGGAPMLMIPSLRRRRPDWNQMLDGVSALYLAGHQVDWRGMDESGSCRVVDLPTYPFQRQRFWFRSATPRLAAASGTHPLLGGVERSPLQATCYRARVSADSPGFVREHAVLGRIVMPAAAYLEMLIAGGEAVLRTSTVVVEDVTIGEAMLLEDDGSARLVHTAFERTDDGAYSVSTSSVAVSATDAEPWVRHVSARLRRDDQPPPMHATPEQLREGCPTPVAVEDFYRGFEARGLNFGPELRLISALWRGPSQALGKVTLSAASVAEHGSYRIHPALLDGCIQVIAAGLMDDDAEPALYLPIGVGSFVWFGASSTTCWTHVTLRQPGSGELRRADVRIFDADARPVATLHDIQFKRASRDALERPGDRWPDSALYEVAWRPAPLTGEHPGFKAQLPRLVDAATLSLEQLRRDSRIDFYDASFARLEAISVVYILHALHQLGWRPARSDVVGGESLAERLGVISRHRRLFGRLLAILAEGGWLVRDGADWRVARDFLAVEPDHELVQARAACPDAKVELELLARVAGELAAALRGERDPAELLFPGGSLDLAERLYRDSPTARLFNGLAAEVIGAVATARARGRALRILEVGGGTGGTSAHVLRRLRKGDAEYTFTDVGPTFVAQARERFAEYPFVQCSVLDLEQDPSTQGFAGRTFDIIIAANVIHATADLRRTLSRVRRLLVPGGLLVMLEVTTPQRWFDLTVGLTEGWWAFTDTEVRADYALMSRDQWLRMLPSCGFDRAETLPRAPEGHGSLARQSMIIARAGEAASQRAERDWLLFADEGGFVARLAGQLRSCGDRCTLVHRGQFRFDEDEASIDPGIALDYRRLLDSMRTAGRTPTGVMHAWALDSAPWDQMSEARLDSAQANSALSPILLAQALAREDRAPRLWLVTRGGQNAGNEQAGLSPIQAAVWGIGRTLALEHPELHCVCVDLDPASPAGSLDGLVAELGEVGDEYQIAWRSDQRYVARLTKARRKPVSEPAVATTAAWRLAALQPGTLDAFTRVPMEHRALGPYEVEIAVRAAGLNFKDVLNALMMRPGAAAALLGSECAGRITRVGAQVTHSRIGDEVMAVAPGCFASHVIAPAELTHQLPTGLSIEAAAGFPIAFITAEYCLSHEAGMQAGETLLIHAAAGGVGMAAVELARRAGVDVFATAGSDSKRALLRAMGVRHVFDSRSSSFADEILALTDGRGVDIVLNSLTGEILDASFRAIGRGGRFVEIGQRGIKSPEWVAALGRDIRYTVVDWSVDAASDPARIGSLLKHLADAVGQGTLAPLARQVFDINDASRAFRFMAQARHVGKVVLRHAEPGRPAIAENGTYLVTGGLSGLGLLVAEWLARSGAGRLVLIGRRGVTDDALPTITRLRDSGTRVIAEAGDVTDEAALSELLSRIRRDGPPLRGIVHCAGVLDDAALAQQHAGSLAKVLAPKVRGAWLLDRLTRGDALDLFVLFSSISGVLGSPGQINHAAANAILDQLAHERRACGLCATSIDWGVWANVGAVADRGLTERLSGLGLGSMTPEQGLQALDRVLSDGLPQVTVMPIDWRIFRSGAGQRRSSPFFLESGGALPYSVGTAAAQKSFARVDLREELAAAPESRRWQVVANFLREHVLRALGMDRTRSIDPTMPLNELGLDSLLVVELRNTLASALGQSLPVSLLFDCPTLGSLTDYLLKEVLVTDNPSSVEVAPVNVPVPDSPDEYGAIEHVEDLSDEEVDRLLEAREARVASQVAAVIDERYVA